MKNAYLLVHGAWQGKWAWQTVRCLLEQERHHVVTPDLPGCGGDDTPAAQATLDACVARVRKCAQSLRERGYSVILAGHSMGGAVITQTASRYPGLFSRLIYVCAFLPGDGKSVSMLARKSKAAGAPGPDAIPDASGTSLVLRRPAINSIFFNDCTAEVADGMAEKFTPQPMGPLLTTLDVGDHFREIRKDYIVCARDRAISPVLQLAMAADAGITRIHTLDCGHEPFISCPADLVKLMTAI